MLTAKVRWSPCVGNNLSATPWEDVRTTVGYLESRRCSSLVVMMLLQTLVRDIGSRVLEVTKVAMGLVVHQGWASSFSKLPLHSK